MGLFRPDLAGSHQMTSSIKKKKTKEGGVHKLGASWGMTQRGVTLTLIPGRSIN